jgi:hypothetical protein
MDVSSTLFLVSEASSRVVVAASTETASIDSGYAPDGSSLSSCCFVHSSTSGTIGQIDPDLPFFFIASVKTICSVRKISFALCVEYSANA